MKTFLGITFLVVFAGNGAVIFANPAGWCRWMKRINPYMSVLRYAETAGGRLQLRIVGAAFLLGGGYILVALIKASANPW
jgi:predicted small integral membrane protein